MAPKRKRTLDEEGIVFNEECGEYNNMLRFIKTKCVAYYVTP